MKILLYNPDNGVTRNFMPHLWMFLLQALTPVSHDVLLIDGNARLMDDDEIVQFVLEQGIRLFGIGAMTRMVAKAYRVADAIRAAGIPVMMGGPHVTEVPDEALGRDGGTRHADSVALGEADETWPFIVEDAARGELKEIYQPDRDAKGNDRKPSLQPQSATLPGYPMGYARARTVQSCAAVFASVHEASGNWLGALLRCPYGDGSRLPVRM
jgi:radical SAM superfamily enzyme YgiQ (UPF0313 family)